MKVAEVAAVLEELNIPYFFADNEGLQVQICCNGNFAERMFDSIYMDGPWDLVRWDNKHVGEGNTREELIALIEQSQAMGGINGEPRQPD